MWKISKLSQVGRKAFKCVNVKLRIKKLDIEGVGRIWVDLREDLLPGISTEGSKGVG